MVLAASKAAWRKKASGRVYNVCSGVEYRVRDLVVQMMAMTGLDIQLINDPARFRKAEQPRVLGNNSKLRADTGRAPRVDMAASLAEDRKSTRLNSSH